MTHLNETRNKLMTSHRYRPNVKDNFPACLMGTHIGIQISALQSERPSSQNEFLSY